MLTISSYHTKACFQAWMTCEDLLTQLHEIRSVISKKIVNVVDECAFICLGTFNALKSGSAEVRKLSFLCVGICEECAEMCETLNGEQFSKCAMICRECADRLSKFNYYI